MRGRGGFIGVNVTPAASAINSAASGVWSLREAESLKRAATWPIAPQIPQTISGLQLWLDAADYSTLFNATTGGSPVAGNGAVARWEDKSGNARHAIQDTAVRRPLRKTSIQGGLDVLRFDGIATAGNADRMQIAESNSTFNFLHLQGGTVFVAAINGTQQNYNDIRTWIDNCGLGAGRGFYFGADDRDSRPVNNTAVAISGNAAGNANITTPNDFVVMQSPKVYTAVVNNTASASSRMFLYKNGITSGVANTATGSTTGDAAFPLMIGSSGDNAGGFPFQGDMLEILIYNSALSDADRSAVESYLISKWGIS